MIYLSEQRTWTIGDIIRRIREEQGIALEQLARGLCSVATLSRIEAGDREMDLLLASRVFQRLGYSVDKYEFYASAEELEQWEQRQKMRRMALTGETEALSKNLEQYQGKWKKEIEKNQMQKQFTDYTQGILLLNEEKFSRAVELLEKSVSCTVPNWKKENDWTLMGDIEIEILEKIGDAYEQMGDKSQSSMVRGLLIQNIGVAKTRMKTYLRQYARLLCKNAEKLLEEKGAERTMKIVDEVLQIMSEEKNICSWPELLELKARCMEKMYQVGRVEMQTVLKCWQKAYYISRLFEKWKKAEEIYKHLEDEYQWDCII